MQKYSRSMSVTSRKKRTWLNIQLLIWSSGVCSCWTVEEPYVLLRKSFYCTPSASYTFYPHLFTTLEAFCFEECKIEGKIIEHLFSDCLPTQDTNYLWCEVKTGLCEAQVACDSAHNSEATNSLCSCSLITDLYFISIPSFYPPVLGE